MNSQSEPDRSEVLNQGDHSTSISQPHPTPADTTGAFVPELAELPRPFGRYQLRRLLGKGGMGSVYLAHDPQLDRLVALKIPRLVGEEAVIWRERFLAEARTAATLTHPNICPVHEVGEVNGQPYLTMAFIEGETLAKKLAREGPLDTAAAAELVSTVARAMHVAHRRGIVHRDLKPANLMIDREGRPVVMDFGLAVRASATDDLRLTLTGVALGTPAYMSPEQAGGDHNAIGPSADVYALGVILFELVAGRTPFKGNTFGKLLAQIERDPPPWPSNFNPDVDEALEAIILTALAKHPRHRFASAGEFADALDQWTEGERAAVTAKYRKPYVVADATGEYLPEAADATAEYRPRSRRRTWWLAGAAALLLAVAAGAVFYVKTDYGDLEVRLNDPNAKVDIRVNGQEVTLSDGGKAFRVRAGKNQKLEITGPGFETVSESFDITRGGKTIVSVALKQTTSAKKPTGGSPIVEPSMPGGGEPTVVDPPAPEKPIPFPPASTLIETPGWELLTDADMPRFTAWLTAKRKAGHSVMWLDTYQVADKPLFSAIAAQDTRELRWFVLLDIPPDVASGGTVVDLMRKKIDTETNVIVSASGYLTKAGQRCITLWRPTAKRWRVALGEPTPSVKKQFSEDSRDGFVPRLARPYAVSEGIMCASFTEVGIDKSAFNLELTAGELDDFLETQRRAGLRPNSFAGYVRPNGSPQFAVVCNPNKEKWEWEVSHGQTAAELKVKAAEFAKRGFRPSCITAYPWDGAVRYATVWLKEPLRPVPYPSSATVIETPGWEVLVNADKQKMQEWLDAHKKEKHSVMWLDAFEVNGKPVFTGIVALDDRAPNWTALLDATEAEVGTLEGIKKHLDPETNVVLSMSGYSENKQIRVAMLAHKAQRPYNIALVHTLPSMEQMIAAQAKQSGTLQVLRGFNAGPDAVRYVGTFEKQLHDRLPHALELTTNGLETFLEDTRLAGNRPTSVSGYLKDEAPTFTAAVTPNREKLPWAVVNQLTTRELDNFTKEYAKQGYVLQQVTGYPWNGTVRYLGYWIKEPAKK